MRQSLLPLVIPGLLVACADPSPTEVQTPVESPSDDGNQQGDEEVPPAREMTAVLDIRTVDCFRGTVYFEVKASFTDNGEPTDAKSCTVTFDDGTVINDCGGFHDFGAGGADHVVNVDVVSGIDGSLIHIEKELFVYGPPVGTVTASVCNYDLSYKVDADPAILVNAFVEPSQDLVTDDPAYYLNREYTVRVPSAGDYRVWVYLNDPRGGFNCVSSTEAWVHVTGCSCEK